MDPIHIISQIPQLFSILPQDSLVLVLSALGVNISTQTFKKYLDLQNDHVIVLLAATASAIAAAIPYISNVAGNNPSIFGAHTAEIFGICTATYRIAQIASGYLSKYQIKRKEDESAAAAIDSIGTAPAFAPASETVTTTPSLPVMQPATVSSSSEFEG